MKRKRYDFKITITTSFLAFPNTVQKEHDELARLIIGDIETSLGSKCASFRDCKTGRFRKL